MTLPKAEPCEAIDSPRLDWPAAGWSRSTISQHRIGYSVQAGLLPRHEIRQRLSRPDGLHNSELEVVISLEADAQKRRSPRPASVLARWIFAQSVGFACSIGIAFRRFQVFVNRRWGHIYFAATGEVFYSCHYQSCLIGLAVIDREDADNAGRRIQYFRAGPCPIAVPSLR